MDIKWKPDARPQGRFHTTFTGLGAKRVRIYVRDSRQVCVAECDCMQHEIAQARQALLDTAMLRYGPLPPKQKDRLRGRTANCLIIDELFAGKS